MHAPNKCIAGGRYIGQGVGMETEMSIWSVRHYFSNPARNRVSRFETRNEAVAEMRRGQSEIDDGQCCVLARNEIVVASRNYCHHRISWRARNR